MRHCQKNSDKSSTIKLQIFVEHFRSEDPHNPNCLFTNVLAPVYVCIVTQCTSFSKYLIISCITFTAVVRTFSFGPINIRVHKTSYFQYSRSNMTSIYNIFYVKLTFKINVSRNV